jgi:hypothetical protein
VVARKTSIIDVRHYQEAYILSAVIHENTHLLYIFFLLESALRNAFAAYRTGARQL